MIPLMRLLLLMPFWYCYWLRYDATTDVDIVDNDSGEGDRAANAMFPVTDTDDVCVVIGMVGIFHLLQY